jgi:hypothetical protein
MEWHGAYTVSWVLDGSIKASEVVGSVKGAEEIARYWHKKGASDIRVIDSEGKDVTVEVISREKRY